MTRSAVGRFTIVAFFLIAAAIPSAQEVRRVAPPPEVRALFDALVTAVNGGSADGWEAFAQERFLPELLKKQSRDDRARLYQQIVDRFGSISIGSARREGPDAPLQLNIKGAKANGVIILEMDDGAPRKILDLRLEDPAPAANDGGGVGINASMTSDEIDRRLDAHFTRLAADDQFSGVALVARNGVPVFFKAYGYADREKKIANTIRTRFNLGSVNKAFTQVAIRQLVNAGKLSMSDTLGKFFPDYPQAASRSATVEQLLTMLGGIADFFGDAFTRAPKAQFASNADYFKFVSSQPPLFAPGERNQYCNGCYIALGEIIAKVSGMPYEKYVAQHVFGRAEMTSTGYPRSDRPEPDIALGYTRLRLEDTQASAGQARRGGASLQDPRPRTQDLTSNIAMHGVTGSAAGGGYSTALDLLAYVKALRAGKFPGANTDPGIAGGAPGINAILETRGEWTVIVLANLDPPAASDPGRATADALSR
jgi:CubicO group peptidase (beta-lactamase class C family)